MAPALVAILAAEWLGAEALLRSVPMEKVVLVVLVGAGLVVLAGSVIVFFRLQRRS